MLSEIDNEELVSGLEHIVRQYKDDVAPFAFELVEQLIIAYQRLIQVDPDNDDGESALAAVGCIQTIR
jgi:hypothetical protein